jgi:heptosyltransferase-3
MPSPRNILIYRLGSLGDTVVALPCFYLIRKTFPQSKITILTNQPVMGKAAPAMAILENSGLCDEAIAYPVGTRDTKELGKVRQAIRQMQPELFIHLAAGRGLLKSLRDYVFFKSCGVKKLIGTPLRQRDLHVRQLSDGTYEPEVERLLSRIVSLGAINPADRSSWDLGLAQDERNQASKLLPPGQKNYLAMSLGTKVPVKDWGEDNWGKLLALLSPEMPDVTLVLFGAADEWERSEKLGKTWTGGCVNLCGKTSPRVSAAVLERCRLFIGHDSGPMHLASVVGIPTIGLFAWHNPPGQWFPGHRSWKFIKAHYPPLPPGGWKLELQMRQSATEGIRLIKPEEVRQSAMELWHDYSEAAASVGLAKAITA